MGVVLGDKGVKISVLVESGVEIAEVDRHHFNCSFELAVWDGLHIKFFIDCCEKEGTTFSLTLGPLEAAP